ncbi:TPA: YafY family transcriptional regulator [Bacillus cereus]|nr:MULTISPECIES: YafY family protein [Bacillus]MCX2703248.1 YafY family protein [Bacillus sp. AS_5]KAB7679180.1 YafY family transcriptional regulator [Bacillus sp. B1-WWTP-T-0.5-Post-4]KMQ25855.1 hypothetical protein TU58_19120 [Bacillus cereus]MCW4654534.1 YafY family transcriptional regulator [Bacillus sp. AS_3]MEB9340126.1 YafY family protein [Bacillus cereus]
MSKTKRIIRIMLALNNNNSITAKELAKSEGVSERTILRDIQELSEIYFPVYSERGRNGGFSTLKNKMIPPIWFSEDEIIALFFAIDAMQYVGATPFSTSYNVILNKLFNMIPQETSDAIENTRDKILMWQPNIKVDKRVLRNLYDASVEEKTVNILYETTEDEIYREIEPMGLYVYNGYWYCPAYCRMRRGIRLFRVDRIKKTIINSTSHSTNVHSNVKEWLYSECESNLIKLEVSLSKEGKRKAESISWLRDNMEYNSDGTAKITKNINPSEEWFYVELLWNIGQEAEIIEPDCIKNKLIERAKSVITKYNDF